MKSRKGSNAGFTLIELLAVMGIIVLVSSVVLVNNARFGGVVQLQTLAYDIALNIRQAQVYGISVQRFGTNTFSAGYGVDFDITSPANATNYKLFADALTKNGLYDCPAPNTNNCELVQTTTISKGYRIHKVCVTPQSQVENCAVKQVDILFIRPEPDALISGSGNSCVSNSANCQASARIELISPRGDTMSIVVEASGQISVKRVSP